VSTLRERALGYFRGHPIVRTWTVLSPTVIWLFLFTLVPIALTIYYSFLTRGAWGTTIHEFSLDSYRELADPLFLQIFLRTLKLSVLTVVICLVGGYLLAYWIAMYGGKHKNLLLFLVILPFWTSPLVRVYSWMIILSDHGLVNSFLSGMDVISGPLPLLHTETTVLMGLVYAYIPFMILPLYASLDRLDRSLLEAASDLGATATERFLKITVPLTKGGMLAGSILVFAPTIGEFIIPELLGGSKAMMIGKFIEMKFLGLRHWPLGSAYSLLLLTIVLALLYVYMRAGGGKEAFQEGR
jgi:spermidine/putrescine transport system permease protein